MSELLISARGLTKRYGDFEAVAGIDFAVAKGESFGLLGPNGAGKSTTMRILSATSQRSSGELSILGLDPEKRGPQVRAHLGVVPQQDNLDTELTVSENLYVYGRYFGLEKKYILSKVDELLSFAQLEDKRDVKVDALSGGMKRRLTIARALISEPDILMLCDRLIVMDKGRIMAEGSPAELIKTYATREVLEVRFGSDRNREIAPIVRELCDRMEELPDRLLLYVDDGEALLEEITERDIHPNTSLVRRSSLEDVFLRLTGRTLIE